MSVNAPRLSIPAEPVWRLSVAQYHAMLGAGILGDDEPIELLEGWLIAQMTKTPRHSVVTQLIRDALAVVVPTGWFVSSQAPITTLDSEPEPDVMIVRGSVRDYATRHPGPAEVALVVEVADASLKRDRTLKLRVYARAGIPLYWLVNVQTQQIEVYTTPFSDDEEAGYTTQTTVHVDGMLALPIAGVAVEARTFFV